MSEVRIRKPLALVGIIKTVAFKHETFKHPASAIRINYGKILSPAATFSNTPLTHGLKYASDYFAHNSPSLILERLSAKCLRPIPENFIKIIKKVEIKKKTNHKVKISIIEDRIKL